MDAREFIDAYLSHEYDPVKAKEYYERTKKLKGRKKGTALQPVGTDLKPADASGGGKTPPKATTQPAPKGANRMAVLNARLGRLNEILDLLDSKVAAAQARSGVVGVAKKTASTKKEAASTTPSKDKPKSSAEKKEAAKAAAKAYDKNKTGESSKSAQAVQDEIEEVQKKIADARDELVAALAKARASSPKPKTATKDRPGTELKKQKGPSK